jgi:uncharacterized protein (TIGR02453 family)
MPKASAPAFAGFARDAIQFWHELAAEMSRDWFAANKQRYETTWVRPMTALLEGAAAKLQPVYRPKKLGTPRILRIQRDIRFSKDKSPYKTWIGGGVPIGARKPNEGPTALYVHFGVEEEYVGAGQYVFMDETLARWRRAVAGKSGAEIAKIVAALKKAGFSIGAYETLSRVPRGFEPDHPRAELLRMKGLVVGFPPVPRGLIHKPAFLDWLVAQAKTASPLPRWIVKHLG